MKPNNDLKNRSIKEFDNLSSRYDYLNFFFSPFYNRIKIAVGNARGKKILSVGSGTATFEIDLARSFSDSQITCLDISSKMLDKAREKAKAIPNINFTLGDVENLPYEPGVFDIVVCSHSFHHYPDQVKALFEIRRVLKQGGVLVLVDALKDTLLGKAWVYFIETILEPGVKHYTSSDLIKMLNQSGFKHVDLQKIILAYGLSKAS